MILETKLIFQKKNAQIMETENQYKKILITAIKTKTTHTSSLLYICSRTWFHTYSKIKLIIEKTKKQNKIQRQKVVLKQNPGRKKIAKNTMKW